MSTIRGPFFIFLWFTSILVSVVYIFYPLLILLLINRKWFRKTTDIIVACWECYPAALLEILMGCKVEISGDYINPNEGAILIMNHRNRLDWFFLWAALLHGSKPPAHRCKFVLKSDVKHIPGLGWGMQMTNFLYIYRNWEKDQILLERSLRYFKQIDSKYQILIFPEGTDFTAKSKAKSDSFALKNDLPKYNYCLHPRTTGFSFLVNEMKKNCQIDAVYDFTIGYPKTLPHSEWDAINGQIPEEVHFHIKKHNINTLPDGEEKLKVWCEERWKEKEKLLDNFYKEPSYKRRFSEDGKTEQPWNLMYLNLVVWTLWTIFGIYIFFTNYYAFWWAIIGMTICVLVSIFTDGFQMLEIDLHDKFDLPEAGNENKSVKINNKTD